MQSCNGRQAVMSALEALVLAGKGLNAFSVLLALKLINYKNGKIMANISQPFPLKLKLSPNGENWSMEKFENFCRF
jgi:hypothetical protein